MITRYNAEFFYTHGSRCHDPKSRVSMFDQWWANAEAQAATYAKAKADGYTWTWGLDGYTNREWTDEGPEYGTWVCTLFDAHGSAVNSIGCIDLGGDGNPYDEPYASCVEADMAVEELS